MFYYSTHRGERGRYFRGQIYVKLLCHSSKVRFAPKVVKLSRCHTITEGIVIIHLSAASGLRIRKGDTFIKERAFPKKVLVQPYSFSNHDASK